MGNSYRLVDFLPYILGGLPITLAVMAVSAVAAGILAFAAGLTRAVGGPFARTVAAVYVEFFRGTSLLVQLFWFFYALPLLGISLGPFVAGTLAIGLNMGAYGAEIVRGCFLNVAKGQREAARALGLRRHQSIALIELPQAFRTMIPPFGNLLIELLKSTSIVSLVTLSDLTFRAYQANQTLFRTTEIFALILVVYFVLSLLISFAMGRLSRRYAKYAP